ncbi:uncharacterized protein [Chlorocebus sabaeus]|uniref:uncharacterized protein n=1 Tax=Chlorocebus sabaeus TaxID=60711 RepID=UPI003BF9FD8F
MAAAGGPERPLPSHRLQWGGASGGSRNGCGSSSGGDGSPVPHVREAPSCAAPKLMRPGRGDKAELGPGLCHASRFTEPEGAEDKQKPPRSPLGAAAMRPGQVAQPRVGVMERRDWAQRGGRRGTQQGPGALAPGCEEGMAGTACTLHRAGLYLQNRTELAGSIYSGMKDGTDGIFQQEQKVSRRKVGAAHPQCARHVSQCPQGKSDGSGARGSSRRNTAIAHLPGTSVLHGELCLY